jgi:hypothetical protein
VSWDRARVSAALQQVLGPATGVTVHPSPPETVNPMCVVIGRPVTVSYGIAALGVDEASLPLILVGGIETEDRIETLKSTCRQAVLADPGLAGTVHSVYPAEERNWRNMTGAGGVQLLTVDLILTIQM